ncbi:DUF2273 domain-containing protein [Phosphitispora sp. TUW77]|uniref:DUF2273 domain-containing protein n=1 Tax=Phosphitispora sp. TUW77 TaxID=3152361 RepID=UPI003AB3B2DD
MSGQTLQEFIAKNLGKLLGVLIGLVLGWMIIAYGVLETLFVVVLIVLGYIFGNQLDEGDNLRAFVDRIFKR